MIGSNGRSPNKRLREAVIERSVSQRRHVTPADFADMVTNDAWAELDVTALHTRADELEQQRSQASRDVLRNALIDAGVTEDGVDAALAQLVAGGGATAGRLATPWRRHPRTPRAENRVARRTWWPTRRLGGSDYGETLGDLRGLSGPDLIEAALLNELGNKRTS